ANQFRSMPTQAERTGDFSHSVTGASALIPVLDPLNPNSAGAAIQFPGNIIPQSRISGWGQAMLNFFPLPNTSFGQGTAQYLQDNFQAAGSAAHPRRNDIVRLDLNLTSKLNGYIRWGHDADDWVELFQSSQFLKGPTGTSRKTTRLRATAYSARSTTWQVRPWSTSSPGARPSITGPGLKGIPPRGTGTF